MSQLRIAVLNAAHRDENTTRNFRRELDASLAEFDVTDGTVPDDFEYDGAVVTGSRASVYWDDEWMAPVKEWVGEAIDRGVPFLGVCWGTSCWPTFSAAPSRTWVSTRSATARSSRSWMQSRDCSTASTRRSPPSPATPTRSPSSRRVPSLSPRTTTPTTASARDRVFGVQFHPEYDTKTARELVHRKELSDERLESILGEITDANYQRSCEAKLVFDNFLEFARELKADEIAVERDGQHETVRAGRSD